jgi:hypothetical protein
MAASPQATARADEHGSTGFSRIPYCPGQAAAAGLGGHLGVAGAGVARELRVDALPDSGIPQSGTAGEPGAHLGGGDGLVQVVEDGQGLLPRAAG